LTILGFSAILAMGVIVSAKILLVLSPDFGIFKQCVELEKLEKRRRREMFIDSDKLQPEPR
jgi:hypothetical protein